MPQLPRKLQPALSGVSAPLDCGCFLKKCAKFISSNYRYMFLNPKAGLIRSEILCLKTQMP